MSFERIISKTILTVIKIQHRQFILQIAEMPLEISEVTINLSSLIFIGRNLSSNSFAFVGARAIQKGTCHPTTNLVTMTTRSFSFRKC